MMYSRPKITVVCYFRNFLFWS